MKKPRDQPSATGGDLRRRAEAIARSDPALPAVEVRKLLHELQVHQIELELQNAELREARAEAEANLERYADLYDFAPVGYFTLDRSGVIQQLNLTGARLLGRERPAVVGRRFDGFITDESLAVFNDVLANVFASQRKEHGELRLRGPDRRPLFVRFEASLDETGQACRATILEVTESERIENELRIAASVYQTIEEAVLIVDAQTRIVAVNAAFSRQTGYAASDVLGQDPKLLKSGRHGAAFYRTMWQTLLATGHWEGEIINRRKNGEEFPEWLSINTLFDGQGRVLRRIGLFSDMTEQKKTAETVGRQANYDQLTGLPNRRLFQDRLQQEIDKMHRADRALALLFIDLDGFKEVNDTLGHAVGDRVLIDSARRICACVRRTDTVARLGGDEFTVIMSDLVATERVGLVAQAIVERLVEPFQIDAEKIYLSGSIGITLYPADGTVASDLLKHADQAMYAAKNLGRNRFNYFTAEMQAAALARLQLIKELREALASAQFEVYFQPIVDLRTGDIVKAEALLRWHHPTRGLVCPAEFIAAAEDTGLINELGDWVFREAAAWVMRRQQQDVQFQVSVNKSPIQFLSTRAQGSWLAWLQQIGLAGESLVIEVTEGLLLSDRPATLDKLRQYRQAGVGLAIDDFGTGYSALSYLKKFDIDYLKIDRSFIRDLATDPDDRAMAEAIIVMAHKLGIRVIAEGVETAEQRDWLAAASCDYAQGFLFAGPRPAREIDW